MRITFYSFLQSNDSWRQRNNVDQPKRYSAVLVEEMVKSCWFARVMLLFYLETLATLDPDNAEFVCVKYPDFTPRPDKVDTVLICACLWEATDKEFDPLFKHNPSSCGTIAGGCYTQVPLSPVSFCTIFCSSTTPYLHFLHRYRGRCTASTWAGSTG